VAHRPQLHLAGIDLTEAMLEIAKERLRPHPQIAMHLQNVTTLALDRTYDLAFSYGGVWYFVRGELPQDFVMVSHIRDEQQNQQGFDRVAEHLPVGGTLLLGIQSAHLDYVTPVANGMEYAQQITPIPDGFSKRYSLADDGQSVMGQTIDYRTYSFEDAIELLDKCGFEYRPQPDTATALFLEFCKR
jgi:hypothetical protein